MDSQSGEEFCTRLAYVVEGLVEDFDIVELLDRLVETCVALCHADAAGFLVADQTGALRVLASSSEQTRHLELLEVQNQDGPCPEAMKRGLVVAAEDLAASGQRWPCFTPAALALGIRAAYAVPLQLRGIPIGALNLFFGAETRLSDEEVQVARIMTNVATIAIVAKRHLREREVIAEQLQTALDSRVLIEQAKGVIAERAGVDVADAFELIRSQARASRRPLTDVAAQIARTTATHEPNPPDAPLVFDATEE